MICGACLAVPLAAIGVTSMSVSMCIGLQLTILSCAIYIYYRQFNTDCVACRGK